MMTTTMFNASFVCLYLLAAALLKPCRGFHVQQQLHKLPCCSKGSSLLASPSGCSTQENSSGALTAVSVTPAAGNPTKKASRRDLLRSFGTSSAAVAFSLLVNNNNNNQGYGAFAFDGSGASVSSGLSPATKAEKKKKFQERIVADVRDFNTLGKTIDGGETQGPGWVNFFILFQRREADSVGRTYAALADLRGLPTKKSNEFEGGGGLLLANTFTKQGKPPDNTPAVKSFLKLSKTFDAIQAAGKAGDAAKAKKEWLKTSELLSQYLSDVELPGDLNDPLYK